jgi:adenosylmethionine-8-amino-7-oxononanoate aminotransferase
MASPIWHPFTQHALQPDATLVARGEGAWLVKPDGRRLLDAISSWWVVTHGHCHPKIVAAIKAQAETLDQVIFAGFTHEPAERVAAGLIGLAPPGLSHVFFSDSGSTAVEVALKMALGYWRNIGAPRSRIVALEHGYHGDTIGTMSAGARGVFNAAYAPLLFDVTRLPFPGAGAEQATLDALEAACVGEKPAALIVEPLILGAGGMLMYPAAVLAEMAAVCARHDVLFIADEVMTGFGRTGTLFACEQAGVTPDIMCVAKGLTGGAIPLAATLCRSRIFEAHLSADRAKTFFHSSSYTANPIACAAAAANLDIWRDEPVLQRISDIADWQSAALDWLGREVPVGGARQLGTITAVDIKVDDAGYLADAGPRLYASLLEQDVLLRPLGSTIYVMPPYCVSEHDIGTVYQAIAHSVRALA